jgi:hydroxyacylglutathione hydrolase
VALAIDPANDGPVERFLAERRLQLAGIFLTHHHSDHVGRSARLAQKHACRVFGPKDSRMPAVDFPIVDKQEITVAGIRIQSLHTPGHTRTHLCYYLPDLHALFTGDTLFAGGCGRMFEGSAEEMYASLQRLAALPEETTVWFGHEYTVENYAFAVSAAPEDPEIVRRREGVLSLHAQKLPTTPSTIGEERRSNLFVRAANPADFGEIRGRKDAW